MKANFFFFKETMSFLNISGLNSIPCTVIYGQLIWMYTYGFHIPLNPKVIWSLKPVEKYLSVDETYLDIWSLEHLGFIC